jgi:type VI secretion system protein ImpJ
MSWDSKVVWFEGMFLRPQHFQQQERYLEAYSQGRCRYLRPYDWGFSRLQLDMEALALGQVSISAARGILPDGTPFDIPNQDDPPSPLEVATEVRGARVLLALPLQQSDKPDIERGPVSGTRGRYRSIERGIRDSNIGSDDLASIEVGKRQLRLMVEGEDLGGWAAVGAVRLLERLPDRTVRLDEGYIPPCLDCQASTQLTAFVKKVLGRLGQVAEEQVEWVRGRGRLSDIQDFLYLQVLNRYEALLGHLSRRAVLHPEELYRLGLQVAAELAIFTSPSRRPRVLPPYQHDDLQTTFKPLMEELLRALDWTKKRTAVPVPLEKTAEGVYVGRPNDPTLLQEASFILAVNAEVPPETLQGDLPQRLKIGAVERIARLVNDRLPGVRVRLLPGAPHEIPSYTGFTYFQLERHGQEWQELAKSGAFALYMQGRFPGLTMSLWGIRGESGGP